MVTTMPSLTSMFPMNVPGNYNNIPQAPDFCFKFLNSSQMKQWNIDSTVLCCPYDPNPVHIWAPTPINTTVTKRCPAKFQNVEYNPNEVATRFCNQNGSWETGNYERCIVENWFRDTSIILWTVIYSISAIALFIALFIFRYFRVLRCLRNSIHVNLIISFILRVLFWFAMTFPPILFRKRNFNVFYNYATMGMLFSKLANFFWMLTEGVYLLIAIAWTFKLDKFVIYHYCIIGWGLPLILVSIAMILVQLQIDTPVWVESKYFHVYELFTIHIPIFVSIVVNIGICIFIVYTLVKKLKSGPTTSNSRRQVGRFSIFSVEYKKAIKAVVVLIPLLGIIHACGIFEGGPLKKNKLYLIIVLILKSSQGFLVSLIYCFLNYEVRQVLAAKFRSLRGRHSSHNRTELMSQDERFYNNRSSRSQFECKSLKSINNNDNKIERRSRLSITMKNGYQSANLNHTDTEVDNNKTVEVNQV